MPLWDQLDMTYLIRQILSAVPPEPTYNTGRPFLTTYQIAIEFARRFPQETTAIGHATGGEGHGPYAVTTYIARWLPDRIQRGANDIEMAFLDAMHMSSLQFEDAGTTRTATTNQAGFNATMFRLRDQASPLAL